MTAGVNIYGSRVVMPVELLHKMVARQQYLATTIDGLHRRLEARETLLMRALHELAVVRAEKEPQNFIRKRMGGRGGAIGRP